MDTLRSKHYNWGQCNSIVLLIVNGLVYCPLFEVLNVINIEVIFGRGPQVMMFVEYTVSEFWRVHYQKFH